MENISYSDITMKNVDPAISLTCFYMYNSAGDAVQRPAPKDEGAQPVTEITPVFRNIRFSNLTATAKSAGVIRVARERDIERGSGERSDHRHYDGLTVKNVKGIQFKNVQVTTKEGPPLIMERPRGGPERRDRRQHVVPGRSGG